MPSFEIKVDQGMPELEGIRLSETQRIKEARYSTSIAVTHCKYQEEGLIMPPPGPNSIVIDNNFVFGKFISPTKTSVL